MDDMDLFVLRNDVVQFLDNLASDLTEEASIVVDAILIQKCLIYLVEDYPDVAYSNLVLQIADATNRILSAVPQDAHDHGVNVARQISEFSESVRKHYG